MSATSKRKRAVRQWARETPKARRKRLGYQRACRWVAQFNKEWNAVDRRHARLLRERIAATAEAMSAAGRVER